MREPTVVALWLLVLLVVSDSTYARTWHEAEGDRTVEAELIAFEDGKVRLRLADGRIAAAPLSRFSPSDREYVLQWQEARQRAEGGFRNIERAPRQERRAGPPKRLALLIGVNHYDRARDLNYCSRDVVGLREALLSAGFEDQDVVSLTDDDLQRSPTKADVEAGIEALLGSFDSARSRLIESGKARADDIVVVSFSGHGLLVDDQSYLCPSDADSKDTHTLISLTGLYRQLELNPARQKLLIIDACRNEPRPGGTRSESQDDFLNALNEAPQGVALLHSCDEGQVSVEDRALGHGVFMHFVIQGWSGAADRDANRDNFVSLFELFRFASRNTREYAAKKWDAKQTPMLKAQLSGDFLLGRARGSIPIPAEFLLREEKQGGPPALGASVEVSCRRDDNSPWQTLGSGISDPEGRAVIDVVLSEEQRRQGTFQVTVSLGHWRNSWSLPAFPETRKWTLYVPRIPLAQLLFQRPEGMQVRRTVNLGAVGNALPAPCRMTVRAGAFEEFRIGQLEGREGVELFPSILVAPSTAANRPLIEHGTISINFSEEDVDQAMSGNFLTKVIISPAPGLAPLRLSGVDVTPLAIHDYQSLSVLGQLGGFAGQQSLGPNRGPGVGAGSRPQLPASLQRQVLEQGTVLAVLYLGNRDKDLTVPQVQAGVQGTISQILFGYPEGMRVTFFKPKSDGLGSESIVAPGRIDLSDGATYRVKFSNLEGYKGIDLYGSIEVPQPAPDTANFLGHSAVPIQLTQHDIDNVLTGHVVTKVVFLPSPQSRLLTLAGIEALVQVKLDPGVNPIEEAQRRGAIVAIMRLGNRDWESP